MIRPGKRYMIIFSALIKAENTILILVAKGTASEPKCLINMQGFVKLLEWLVFRFCGNLWRFLPHFVWAAHVTYWARRQTLRDQRDLLFTALVNHNKKVILVILSLFVDCRVEEFFSNSLVHCEDLVALRIKDKMWFAHCPKTKDRTFQSILT